MAADRNNVVVLPDRRWDGRKQPGRPELLRTVVGQLDELSRRLQHLSPQSTWSARRWMIASTPFRMRVTGARKRLGELAASCPACDQTDVYWMLELKDAGVEAERRIRDIEACLQTLQHKGTCLSARARETEKFTSSRSDLAEAARRMRNLLFQGFSGVSGHVLANALTDMSSTDGPRRHPRQEV